MKTMKNTMKCFIAVFVMAMAFVMTGITAEAAVAQTAQDKNSITIQWDAKNYASAYYIGYAENSSDARAMAEAKTITLPATTTSYTITGLKPGTEYYVCVYGTYKYSATGSEYTNSIATGYDFTTLPTKVTGLNQTKWWYYIENVDFAWNEQSAANFEVVVMNSKGKKIKSFETSSNKSGYDDVKNNNSYQVKVRAKVVINGQTYYGDWSDKAYLFTQPMVTKSSVSNGKLTIKWGKITGVNSYDVYVSTKEKKGYKKVKSLKASKTSLTVAKLKGKKFSSSKKYYVYIVAKKKVGKKTYTSGRHYTCTVKGSSSPSVNWTFD